ncbi:hypothetical protein GTW29_33555 [Streptomyces sp. SID7834]|nr:endonuclease domain-containing protein [Streptomyces sp. SID7834]MYT61584.1 hypothetical protein [Streptomyces sp. SID7834]
MSTKNNKPACSFEDCGKPIATRKSGLCSGHYQQQRNGLELTPLRSKARNGEQGIKPACSFSGCGKSARYTTLGLCDAHYQQQLRGVELMPLEARKSYSHWVAGWKVCPGCGVLKGESAYPKDVSKTSGYRSNCLDCDRWRNIKRTYDLTRNEYQAIWAFQGERCGACGTDEPGSVKGFALDHDHDCCPGKKSCGDCIQGILCLTCNAHGDRYQHEDFLAYRSRVKALGQPLRTLVVSIYQLTA